MTTPQTAPAPVECDVATHADIVAFVHNLGGTVDVIGFTVEGERVGVIVNEITADEVEVIPGAAVRLVATLHPDDE